MVSLFGVQLIPAVQPRIGQCITGSILLLPEQQTTGCLFYSLAAEPDSFDCRYSTAHFMLGTDVLLGLADSLATAFALGLGVDLGVDYYVILAA